MHLDQIWRYPVTSMAGARLEEALLGPLGIPGDRIVQAYDTRGRVVTARAYPRLLGHKATLGPDGEPRIDGLAWADPAIGRAVEGDVGPGARLARSEDAGRFDVLPLLVATDGAIAAFGYDLRRLRPNLVIAGVPGLAERRWEGARIRIGAAVIALERLRGRCVMTTFDPDTLEQDVGVLRSIAERFDGTLALNAAVEVGGRVRVGAAVELMG